MIETTLCYIEKNDQYLMLHRTKKNMDPSQGKWIGVGGKLLPNESADECVVREVKEETGLTLTDYRFRATIDFVSDIWEEELMYLYSADGFTGDLMENCNEGDLLWVDKSEIENLNLWEGDRIFLRELLVRDNPYFLRVEYQGDKLVNWYLEDKYVPPKS